MLNSEDRVLVLSPHSDDAELGCGGLIARLTSKKIFVHVCCCLITVPVKSNGEKTTIQVRMNEFLCGMSALGVESHSVLYESNDNIGMDRYSRHDVVSSIDGLILEHEITTLLIPVPSFHQDHQYIYQCGISASRHTKDKTTLREVYAYEYPASNWGESASNDPAKGGVYVCIDDYLDAKLKAVSCHKSQLYSSGYNPISLKGVMALAEYRGIEAGCKYAELLYLLRAIF